MENFKAAMEEHKEDEIDEPAIYKKQKLDRDDVLMITDIKEDSNDS
jgi:hypothetical protein